MLFVLRISILNYLLKQGIYTDLFKNVWCFIKQNTACIFFKSRILLVSLSFYISTSFAQKTEANYLPTSNYIYYTNNLTYINPGGQVLTDKFSLNLKYASYTGLGKELNETYSDAWLKVDKNDRFAVGLQFNSNNQGPYIHLVNSKLLTRYKIPVTESISVNPGIGIGALNYTIEGNATTSGGSSFVPDLDLGVSLQSKAINVGISGQHFIDRKLQPLEASFEKSKLINTYFSYKKRFSADIELKSTAVSMYRYGLSRNDFDLIEELIYKEHYKLVALLYHGNSMGYGISFENIETTLGNLGFNLMYSSPVFNNTPLSSNRYEVGIQYFFKREVTFIE